MITRSGFKMCDDQHKYYEKEVPRQADSLYFIYI